MALNGAYRVLLDAGIVPTYFAMLDARAANVNFIEKWDDRSIPMLASQVHPDVRSRFWPYDVLTFHLNTPTTRRVFPTEKVYVGGGGTIGLTAIALGALLGYRHIVLLGYDSSYTDGKSHARPQPQNEGQVTLPVWCEDREYLSTPAMAQQVMDFFPWHTALQAAFPGIVVDVHGQGLFYDYVSTNNKVPTRESEAAKYTTMYSESEYRMPAHRLAGIRDILHTRRGTSLLDVGTGRGETLLVAGECGYTLVAGTETVDALVGGNVVKALLPDLPILDGAYETVTCFEVIEHLLPIDVEPALRELARCASKRVIISAATRSDMRSGVELHPSWKSEEEWTRLLGEVWGAENVKMIGNLSSCGLSPVYEYVKP